MKNHNTFLLLICVLLSGLPLSTHAEDSNPVIKAFTIVQEKLTELADNFKRPELVEVDAKTTRDDENTDTECNPSVEYQFPTWPKKGTTLLAGQLLIRDEQTGKPCQKVTYTIQEAASGTTIKSLIGQAGALALLSFEGQPNNTYQWYTKSDEQVGSKSQFTILPKHQSELITVQMQKLADLSRGLDPLLVQALYLQELTDNSSEYDLYEDSIQLLQQYRKDHPNEVVALYTKLLERAWVHLYL